MFQCLVVRPEARAREFIVVARLRVLSSEPKRKRFRAGNEAESFKQLESLRYDLKPDDLFLGKAKPSSKRVEA